MLVRRLAAVAAVAAVALALSSCSEDPVKPKPLEPETSSSSPTSTPSETPKPESAKDVIRRWIAASNEMQTTGDTTAYREITRHCGECKEVADHVERIYENGGYIEFEGERILDIARTGGSPKAAAFEMRTRSGPTRYTERKGGPVKTYGGGKVTYRVTLELRNDRWFITSSEGLPS